MSGGRPETPGKEIAVAALNGDIAGNRQVLARTEFRASVRQITTRSGHKTVILDVHHEDGDEVVPLDKALGNVHIIVKRLPADQRLPKDEDERRYAAEDPLPASQDDIADLEREVRAASLAEARQILRTGTENQKIRVLSFVKGLDLDVAPDAEDDQERQRMFAAHDHLLGYMAGRNDDPYLYCPQCGVNIPDFHAERAVASGHDSAGGNITGPDAA